jgi:hypothetical protein
MAWQVTPGLIELCSYVELAGRRADFRSSSPRAQYGNANVQTKRLFQRLKIRSTPAFIAFRGGEVVDQSSGANKEKLEAFVRANLNTEELAGKDALYAESGAAA